MLGCLSDAALDGLAKYGQTRKYTKGEIIFRRGDSGDSVMMLVAGCVKLAIMSAKAREVVLRFVEAGELFGEIAAIDGRERSVSAISLEDSEVFIIQSRDLMPALTANPQAMIELGRWLCERLRIAVELMEDRTFEMHVRIARGLLRIAQKVGHRRKDGIHLQLTVSQEDLGNHLGLARANVSRQLGRLRTGGLIKLDGARIVIIDEVGLAQLAEATSAD